MDKSKLLDQCGALGEDRTLLARVLGWPISTIELMLLAGIAGSELHIYRDCGHWAQWEHADSFNQLVLNFLARA